MNANDTLDSLTVRQFIAVQIAGNLSRHCPGPHVEELAQYSGQAVPAESLVAVLQLRADYRRWLVDEALNSADAILEQLATPAPESAAALVREALELLESASVAAWLADTPEPLSIMAAQDIVRRARERLRRACELLVQR